MSGERPRIVSRLGAVAERLKALASGRSPDRAAPVAQRLGEIRATRPDGLVLWLLADAAAETGPAPAIAQDLSRRMGEPVHALITTVLDEEPCPGVAAQALHQVAPVDTNGSVQRFLEHWRPDFGIVVGTPARPHLIHAAAQRGIPLFHAFAERKPEGRLPGYLSAFHTCLAPSAAMANALRSQQKGDRPAIEIAGPLSDTVYALPANAADVDDIALRLGGRPVWLASGVLPEEIPLIEAAHRKAFRSAHRLLLVVIPREAGHGAEIAAYFEEAGWQAGCRSTGSEPEADVQVYVADTENELGLWYRLAPVAFLGGTFQPAGTPADPFAPAALGSAVLHGPFTGESPWRYDKLDSQNASVLVQDSADLGEAIIALLAPDKAASLAQAGWAVTTESAHVVERLAELMESLLETGEASRP